MNIKKDLKDLGLFLITPFPAKYHFEGVNNKRAAKQLTIAFVAANAVFITASVVGPIVIEEIRYRKNQKKLMRELKKNSL